MSPTIFRARGLRFHFFSKEEARIHVHVRGPEGRAKVWLEPEIVLAVNHGFRRRTIQEILRLIREHEHEIKAAWKDHLGS